MVGLFFSRSIWVMLGVLIMLSIFSSGIKTSRAIFLQIKESPYFEAARAYGAGNFRIIFLYLIPRIIPTLVPSFVVSIPAFVFVEATLAVLNLGDPLLPHLGQSTQRRPRQRRALPGPFLLGARACRTLASLRPRLCHGRFRLG